MKGVYVLIRTTSIWIILVFALLGYVVALQYHYDTLSTTFIGVIIGFIVAKFILRVR